MKGAFPATGDIGVAVDPDGLPGWIPPAPALAVCVVPVVTDGVLGGVSGVGRVVLLVVYSLVAVLVGVVAMIDLPLHGLWYYSQAQIPNPHHHPS